ncbi:MAG: hypothetical protein ACOVOE_05680 [Caulobacter sp.]
MVPQLEVLVRNSVPFTAALTLVSWAVALGEAAPRLLAGPLCTSSQDSWAFAGHCPACYVAAGFTLATLALVVRPYWSLERAAVRCAAR